MEAKLIEKTQIKHVKTIELTGVQVELTLEEALVLRHLVGGVGGSASTSVRGITNELWAAFNRVLPGNLVDQCDPYKVFGPSHMIAHQGGLDFIRKIIKDYLQRTYG